MPICICMNADRLVFVFPSWSYSTEYHVFFQIKAESSRRTLLSSIIAPHVKCYSDRRNRLDGIGLSAGRSLTSIGMISLSLSELVIKTDLKWSYSIVHRARDQTDQMNTLLDRTRVEQRTLCLIIVCIAMFMTSPSTFWSFSRRKTSDRMQIFSLSEWTRGHCRRIGNERKSLVFLKIGFEVQFPLFRSTSLLAYAIIIAYFCHAWPFTSSSSSLWWAFGHFLIHHFILVFSVQFRSTSVFQSSLYLFSMMQRLPKQIAASSLIIRTNIRSMSSFFKMKITLRSDDWPAEGTDHGLVLEK